MNTLFGILNGDWEGKGEAEYPTIQPVKYREKLSFSYNGSDEYLFYRQITHIIEPVEQKDQIIFDESGYYVFKDGKLSLVNSQKSGRVEVYDCHLQQLNDNELRISSVNVMTNDKKLIRVTRLIDVAGNKMTYDLKMELVHSPGLKTHLRCSLQKVT